MTAHLRVGDGERIGVTCGVAQVHAYQWHIVGVARLDGGEMAVVVKQWARFSVGEETAGRIANEVVYDRLTVGVTGECARLESPDGP